MFPTVSVFAEESSENNNESSLITEEEIKERNDEANYGERFMTSIMLAPVNFVLDLFGARDVSYLVFQRPELAPMFGKYSEEDGTYIHKETTDDGVSGVRDEMFFGVFPKEYFEGIAMLYDAFHDLLTIPLAMMLTFAGLVLLINNFNSQDRSKFKDYIAGTIFVVVCLRFGHVLWGIIFDVNYFIVDLIWVTLSDNGIWTGRFINVVFGSQVDLNIIESMGIGLLALVAFFMTFILNFQYTMRMITLSILIFTFPLVSLSLIFPSRRDAMNIWVHEFTSQVFIQAAHALALGMFFYVRHQFGDGLSFWIVCAFMFGLPTVAFLVQKIVGAFTGVTSGGRAENFGTALGVMSLMNMGRMLQNASKGRSTGGANSNSDDAGTSNHSNNSNMNNLGPSTGTLGSSNNGRGSRVPMSDGTSRNRTTSGITGWGEQREATARNMRSLGRATRAMTNLNDPIVRGGVRAGAMAAGGALSAMATGNTIPGLMAGNLASEGMIGGFDNNSQINNDESDEEPPSQGPDHPSHLPRYYQTFASSPEQLRYSNINGSTSSNSNNGETSVRPPGIAYPTNERGRSIAVNRANEGYQNAKDRLKQMNRRNTDPTAYRFAQVSAAQSRSTRNLARNLSNPQLHMATPAQATRQASLATRNYQEAQRALSQMNAGTESHARQEEVVQNARSVMNHSVGYANREYPQLQNPALQESIVNYNHSLDTGNSSMVSQLQEQINNAPANYSSAAVPQTQIQTQTNSAIGQSGVAPISPTIEDNGVSSTSNIVRSQTSRQQVSTGNNGVMTQSAAPSSISNDSNMGSNVNPVQSRVENQPGAASTVRREHDEASIVNQKTAQNNKTQSSSLKGERYHTKGTSVQKQQTKAEPHNTQIKPASTGKEKVNRAPDVTMQDLSMMRRGRGKL